MNQWHSSIAFTYAVFTASGTACASCNPHAVSHSASHSLCAPSGAAATTMGKRSSADPRDLTYANRHGVPTTKPAAPSSGRWRQREASYWACGWACGVGEARHSVEGRQSVPCP